MLIGEKISGPPILPAVQHACGEKAEANDLRPVPRGLAECAASGELAHEPPLLIASISGIEDGQARGIEYANASGEWKVGLDESRESSLGCFGYLGCS